MIEEKGGKKIRNTRLAPFFAHSFEVKRETLSSRRAYEDQNNLHPFQNNRDPCKSKNKRFSAQVFDEKEGCFFHRIYRLLSEIRDSDGKSTTFHQSYAQLSKNKTPRRILSNGYLHFLSFC